MRVIVTGASGKAGSYTARELTEAGHEVVNLDVVRPAGDLPCRTIQLDLKDAGEVYDAFAQVRPEGVCHLAANPSPAGFPRQQTFANNTLSTYHVMQAAGDSGVRRLIYASSEMATGWLTTGDHPAKIPFDEEDRVISPNAYALSKYLGEVIAESMAARYTGMSICSLRINNLILPDQYETRIRQRREDPMNQGCWNYWSYIDVRDIAGAFRAALEGESLGHEAFLIAAADTCIEIPLREALEEKFGIGDRVVPGTGDFQSAFSCAKMERFFGWKAAHSWRDAGISPSGER